MTASVFKQIYTLLDEYFAASETMVRKGLSWAVIISLHEIYRHLYPVEPYVDDYTVADEDRPRYILEVIRKQCDLYSAVATGVIPYPTSGLSGKGACRSPENESVAVATGGLYGSLWDKFPLDDIVKEAKELLEKRIDSRDFSLSDLKDKVVLDLGCGSGRYTVALSTYGCRKIIGYDIGEQGLEAGRSIAAKYGLANIIFEKGDVLNLPYENETFDFVFCNGVLHHTQDMKKGLAEVHRVLKNRGIAFIYLYADKGLFWDFRKRAREITGKIPREYALEVLGILRLPPNRFIFMRWTPKFGQVVKREFCS